MIKCTVQIVKKDGMKAAYHVLACSLGGAENACLERVYEAKTALAIEGWEHVDTPDFITDAAGFELWRSYLKTCNP